MQLSLFTTALSPRSCIAPVSGFFTELRVGLFSLYTIRKGLEWIWESPLTHFGGHCSRSFRGSMACSMFCVAAFTNGSALYDAYRLVLYNRTKNQHHRKGKSTHIIANIICLWVDTFLDYYILNIKLNFRCSIQHENTWERRMRVNAKKRMCCFVGGA